MSPIDRMRADRVGPPQLPINQSRPAENKPEVATRPSFADHLKKACDDAGVNVAFSGHAAARAESRSIELTPEQLSRIDAAIGSISAKGGKKALVMLDDMALIVGIDKRTVITLVDGNSMRENVFTSIDAAVIA